MAIVSFPRVLEELVNLRELWENDAITIINLLNYYIYVSEFLYQYKIKNTLKSIKSCNYDLRLHNIWPLRYTKK